MKAELAEEMLEVLKRTLNYLNMPKCKNEIEMNKLIQQRADVIAALSSIIEKAEEV